MAAVIGFLVGALLSIAVTWTVAGRGYVVSGEPGARLGEIAGRSVSIMGALSGFAVTGMVLLVTLGRNLPDTSATSYTTVVAMFFISWMAYAASAFLYSNVSEQGADAGSATHFDLTAALFAGAAVTLEIAFASGWLALRPLFQAFGLVRLAELAGPILVAAAVASYALLAHNLFRSGYGATRVLVSLPAAAGAVTLVYGIIVASFGLRSEDATLNLIVTAFVLGAFGFALLNLLPIVARHERPARLLSAYARYGILALAQGVVLLLFLLVLSVLGLA